MTIERKVGVAYSIRFGIGAVLYSWSAYGGHDPWEMTRGASSS